MARVEIPVVVTDPTTGHAIQGATVQINKRSDGTAATVFADETSGTTVPNPLTSDSTGNVLGWVARGAYNIVVTASGYAPRTVAWDAVPGADGGIDTAALAGGTTPTGVVMDWPYSEATIPAGWLPCSGAAVSRTTYSALHAIAAASAYPHGSGDGATTFNVPDYRGRTGVGKDDMGGVAANRMTAAGSGITGTTLGATGGAEVVALTVGQLAAHSHSVTGGPTLSGAPGFSDPSHAHTDPNTQGTGVSGSGGAVRGDANGTSSFNVTGITVTVGTLAVSAGSLAVASQGSGSAHQNTQPSLIVNKIIKT